MGINVILRLANGSILVVYRDGTSVVVDRASLVAVTASASRQ